MNLYIYHKPWAWHRQSFKLDPKLKYLNFFIDNFFFCFVLYVVHKEQWYYNSFSWLDCENVLFRLISYTLNDGLYSLRNFLFDTTLLLVV